MKTLFSQAEIQQALVNFIAAQGIVIKDRDINVTFVRGRKGAGITAEVDIVDPTNQFIGRPIELDDEPEDDGPAPNADPAPEAPVETAQNCTVVDAGASAPSSEGRPSLFG